MDGVTHSDIALALQRALEEAKESYADGPVGVTTGELAEYLDCPVSTTRDKLRTAVKEGKVECVGRAWRVNMAGGKTKVPVYAPKK